jgi:hypothetical protein
MEARSYQVTYLLSLSTLPERFYALVHELVGKDIFYKNPGVALRSYIMSKCMRDEIVIIVEPQQTYVRECEEFSASKKILKVIIDSLVKSATETMISLSSQKRTVQITLIRDITELQEHITNVTATYDAFLSIQPDGDKLDIFTMPGIKLRQALYDLQDKIGKITDMLKNLNPEPGRA